MYASKPDCTLMLCRLRATQSRGRSGTSAPASTPGRGWSCTMSSTLHSMAPYGSTCVDGHLLNCAAGMKTRASQGQSYTGLLWLRWQSPMGTPTHPSRGSVHLTWAMWAWGAVPTLLHWALTAWAISTSSMQSSMTAKVTRQRFSIGCSA